MEPFFLSSNMVRLGPRLLISPDQLWKQFHVSHTAVHEPGVHKLGFNAVACSILDPSPRRPFAADGGIFKWENFMHLLSLSLFYACGGVDVVCSGDWLVAGRCIAILCLLEWVADCNLQWTSFCLRPTAKLSTEDLETTFWHVLRGPRLVGTPSNSTRHTFSGHTSKY
jgi:hypothetical protein